jgi:hypothetical protein
MPIIGALLIGSWVFFCVQYSKEKKRARWAAATDATTAAEGVPDAK